MKSLLLILISTCVLISATHAQNNNHAPAQVRQDPPPQTGSIQADDRLDKMAEQSTITVRTRVSSTSRGYRVQIYSGNNRENAQKVKINFMKRFPTIRSYITYSMPYYRIRVGDFASKREAQDMYKHLSATYKNVMIVPSLINKKITKSSK